MHVAVADVAKTDDAHLVLCAEGLDPLQQGRDPGPGDDDVLHVVHRTLVVQGVNDHPPRLPQPVAGGPVARHQHVARPVLQAQVAHDLKLGVDGLLLVAVQLDQEVRRRVVVGHFLAEQLFDGQHAVLLHELDRRGHDAVRDDVGHGVGCRLKVVERHEQVDLHLGQGQQPQHDLGHHGERPLRADEQLDEVIARHVLDQLAAAADHLARGQHRLQAAHIVLCDAVLDRARPAGALGDVAPDRARVHAGGIGRVKKPLGLHGAVDVAGDHARLDSDHEVFLVDLEDTVHLFQRQHNAAVDGDGASAEAVSLAARGHGDALALREPEHRRHLCGRGDAHHDLGVGPQPDGFVVRVRFEGRRVAEHVLLAHNLP